MPSFFSRQDILGFQHLMDDAPFKIPVLYGDKEVAEIKLEFKIKTQDDEEMLPVLNALREVILMPEMIKRMLDITGDFTQQLLKKENANLARFLSIYSMSSHPNNVQYEYSIGDEDVFAVIRKYGFDALLSVDCRLRIKKWLEDKEVIRKRLETVKDCIIEYARTKFSEALDKRGRRRTDAGRKSLREGNAWLRELHKDITGVLGLMKRTHGNSIKSDFRDIGNKSFMTYYQRKIEGLTVRAKVGKGREQAARIKHYLDYGLSRTHDNPISAVLREQGEVVLRREFGYFDWVPKEMASVLVGRLMKVSPSTLENIIWPRKEKHPKSH